MERGISGRGRGGGGVALIFITVQGRRSWYLMVWSKNELARDRLTNDQSIRLFAHPRDVNRDKMSEMDAFCFRCLL